MNRLLKIIPILLLFPLLSFSQTNEVGVAVGAGASEVQGPWWPNTVNHYEFASFGVNFYRTYFKELLCLKTGLSFDYRYKPDDKRPYLRVPVGLDLRFGKKLEAIVGSGIILNYLPGMPYDYIKKFQLGWELNSGLEFSITEKLDISIMAQKNFDLSAMDLSLDPRTQGDYVIIDWIVSDNLLRIGLKYRFIRK